LPKALIVENDSADRDFNKHGSGHDVADSSSAEAALVEGVSGCWWEGGCQ
jgi:hypothetical protein